MKTYLVTGASGAIGSAICECIAKNDPTELFTP
jgi:FlaA1/EpsC-like NDP-sugar epimerase